MYLLTTNSTPQQYRYVTWKIPLQWILRILLGVLQNFRDSFLPLFWDTLGVEIPCIVVHTVELPLTFLLVQIRVEIKNTTGGYENSEVIVKKVVSQLTYSSSFIIHFFIEILDHQFDVHADDDCDTCILVTEKLIRAFDRHGCYLSKFIN
jgi:hypothetical protein